MRGKKKKCVFLSSFFACAPTFLRAFLLLGDCNVERNLKNVILIKNPWKRNFKKAPERIIFSKFPASDESRVRIWPSSRTFDFPNPKPKSYLAKCGLLENCYDTYFFAFRARMGTLKKKTFDASYALHSMWESTFFFPDVRSGELGFGIRL